MKKKEKEQNCSQDDFKCLNYVTVRKTPQKSAVQIHTRSRAACILSSSVGQMLVKINYCTAAFDP